VTWDVLSAKDHEEADQQANEGAHGETKEHLPRIEDAGADHTELYD
jgi:hypothetical protein